MADPEVEVKGQGRTPKVQAESRRQMRQGVGWGVTAPSPEFFFDTLGSIWRILWTFGTRFCFFYNQNSIEIRQECIDYHGD